MPFIHPRARLQLPFHTSADMEGMSVHWITQTKTHSTRTVEQENQSQRTRSQTVNRGLQSPVKHLYCSSHKPRTRSKAMPEINPSPQNSVSAQDFHKKWRTELMSSCRHLPCCQTTLTQFPQLWFENLLGVVLQMAAYLLQLLFSGMKPFGCLQGAWEGPSSSVLHKCVEHIKEITDSESLSSPSLNSTCELYRHRAFP